MTGQFTWVIIVWGGLLDTGSRPSVGLETGSRPKINSFLSVPPKYSKNFVATLLLMGLNLFFVPFFRAFPKFLGNGTKSIFFFPTSRAFPKYCPSSFCHFRIVLFFAENPRFPRPKLFFDPRLLSFLLLQLPSFCQT